jgi:hypothetical protein
MNAASRLVLKPRTSLAARLGESWNRFWFRPADPTPLGLIRICCGLVALYVHLAYGPDLQEFFGKDAWFNLATADEFRHEAPWVPPPAGWADQPAAMPLPANPEEGERTLRYAQRWGVDPRLTHSQGNYAWSLWFHITDPAWMRVAHLAALAIMVLFTLGCFTRITSVLTWAAALSYVQRSPMTLFGMDAMMMIVLFCLMIGPSGAALSVDRLLARRLSGTRQRPAPSASANLALRLLQVHFCIIYLAAGLSKLLGGAWWNGTALWGTLANYEFTPLRYPLYAEALRWLCQHRLAWELVMTAGVLYTLALEISFPFLVWNPRWRGLMVAGSVLLHTGIALTMGLVGFGLIMFTMVLAFVPAPAIRLLLRQLKGMTPRPRFPWRLVAAAPPAG